MDSACIKDCNMRFFCEDDNLAGNNNTLLTDELFPILYKYYRESIYNFLNSKLNNQPSLAEDLTQETFAKVYQNLNKVTDFCGVKSWIYTIANNIFIDHWRKSSKAPQDNPLELNDSILIVDEGISPLQNLIQTETAEDLQSIFQALPPRYLRAIYLNENQNFTYVQAAKEMDLSLSAYTSLLNRARKKLKEIFIANRLRIDPNLLNKHEYDTLSKWIGPIHLFDSVSSTVKHGTRDYFNNSAAIYNELFYHNYHAMIDDYMIGKYPLKKEHIVADFGMGAGIFACRLSPHVKKVVGYDFSQEMCDLANRNISSQNISNVVCMNEDFLKLTNNTQEYDYGYCQTVLHHLTYPQRAIKRMAEMIKEGGALIISDFAKHKHTELVHENSDFWYGFTEEQFRAYLREAGFKNIWVEVHKKFPIAFKLKSGKIIKIPTIIAGGEK